MFVLGMVSPVLTLVILVSSDASAALNGMLSAHGGMMFAMRNGALLLSDK
jgi:hypothetical protein